MSAEKKLIAPKTSNTKSLGQFKEIPSNLYELHLGDNLGLRIISTIINGENYANWSILMKQALNAMDKMGFVNGKITPPLDTSSFSRHGIVVMTWWSLG